MKVIGYIRVSTDKQDFQQQKYSLLNYAQKKKLKINDFIEVEVSSRKSKQERKINELLALLKPGDILLISELSRLGRNMLEILSIIQELTENKINIIFTQQPELSTTGTHGKLILAIYGYFAETEREIISMRTKQGLAAAREKGKLLGRPKGSKNKKARVLDHFESNIRAYLEVGLDVGSIRKLINIHLVEPLSYQSFKYHIEHHPELSEIRKMKNLKALARRK